MSQKIAANEKGIPLLQTEYNRRQKINMGKKKD